MPQTNPRQSTSISPAAWGRGVLLVLLLVGCAYVWWPRSAIYPKVTAPEGLVLIKRLYSTCSRESAAELAEVEQAIAEHAQQGKVSKAESEAFQQIIADAKQGKWEVAARACYRFAEDQVSE